MISNDFITFTLSIKTISRLSSLESQPKKVGGVVVFVVVAVVVVVLAVVVVIFVVDVVIFIIVFVVIKVT